jgi:hypothetical protein
VTFEPRTFLYLYQTAHSERGGGQVARLGHRDTLEESARAILIIFKAMSFGFGAAISFEQRCAGKSSAAEEFDAKSRLCWTTAPGGRSCLLLSLWRRHKAEDDYP